MLNELTEMHREGVITAGIGNAAVHCMANTGGCAGSNAAPGYIFVVRLDSLSRLYFHVSASTALWHRSEGGKRPLVAYLFAMTKQ